MASIRTTTSGGFQVRYRDPNGRQRARNFTRKTDATRFAAAVETDKVRGDWTDPRLGKVTFGEWADEWLGQLSHLKPKTRLDYEVTLRRHVLPLLETAPIATIDRPAMKRFVSDLVTGGARTDVVRISVQIARHVLGVAVDAGALKANPATALRLARPRKAEQLFLTPEQVQAFAEAIGGPYDTLVRFAAYTGLRAGEIGALRVKRIDFLRGRVEVAESVSDVAGRLVVGPTKTYANRHVPLPPLLRDELAATSPSVAPNARAWCSPRHRVGLFATGTSTEQSSSLPYGPPGFPIASDFMISGIVRGLCIASTADPYAVMRRMGHSSITVTYDTYGHMFPERDAEITDRLEDLFRRGVDSPWTPPSPPLLWTVRDSL